MPEPGVIPPYLEQLDRALHVPRRYRGRVMAEAGEHPADAARRQLDQGAPPGRAAAAAVERFGKVAVVSTALHRRWASRAGQAFALAVMASAGPAVVARAFGAPLFWRFLGGGLNPAGPAGPAGPIGAQRAVVLGLPVLTALGAGGAEGWLGWRLWLARSDCVPASGRGPAHRLAPGTAPAVVAERSVVDMARSLGVHITVFDSAGQVLASNAVSPGARRRPRPVCCALPACCAALPGGGSWGSP